MLWGKKILEENTQIQHDESKGRKVTISRTDREAFRLVILNYSRVRNVSTSCKTTTGRSLHFYSRCGCNCFAVVCPQSAYLSGAVCRFFCVFIKMIQGFVRCRTDRERDSLNRKESTFVGYICKSYVKFLTAFEFTLSLM